MQLQPQCSDDLEDGVAVGAPLTGECLIQVFARETSIPSNHILYV